MNLQIKMMLGGSAVLIASIALASLVSNSRVRSLERAVDKAKQQAKESEDAAVAAEIAAEGHVKKIEHLENELAGIGRIARRQDEEIEKIGGVVGGARRDVERARGVRAIDASVEELCRRLAELGHPCD